MGARKKAKEAGEIHYYSNKPCPKGHLSARSTVNGGCLACCNERAKDARLKNPEAVRARVQRWKLANKEHLSLVNKAWRESNPASSLASMRKWRAANPELDKVYAKKYYQENREKIILDAQVRNLEREKRVPSWLTDSDIAKIKEIYKTARELTQTTGIEHHVDHIIPLKGKTVSGLHVPSNLRVIPAVENLRKRNSFTPYTERAAQIGL